MRGPSSRREILLSRETLLGLLAVVVLAAVCVALGLWQFGRYQDRVDEAAVVRANYAAEPVALDEVLPELGAPLAAADDWTPVTLEGSYCTSEDCVLYVRNRQLEGRVGFWQLVPFRTEDGATILVVRGWVPSDEDSSTPADPPAVPEGERTATVRLRPAEPVLDREPPPGQTHSVNPRQSAGLMGLEEPELVAGAYGELVSEDPPAERPAALPAPDTSLGPHLSYAFQWWIFALFFPGALIYHLRRQFQDLAAASEQEAQGGADAQEGGAGQDDAAPQGGATAQGEGVRRRTPAPRRPRGTRDHRPRRAVRTRRRGPDEEEEDALIDQQRP